LKFFELHCLFWEGRGGGREVRKILLQGEVAKRDGKLQQQFHECLAEAGEKSIDGKAMPMGTGRRLQS
jgi:hypothetical protein